jgi:hypothetical protein
MDQTNTVAENYTSAVFPAGSISSITLLFDANNNVNGANFLGTIGTSVYNSTMLFADLSKHRLCTAGSATHRLLYL